MVIFLDIVALFLWFIYSNNYIEENYFWICDVRTIATTNSIKKTLKFAFSGFSLVFIAMLFFVLVHDMLTGESSQTSEYCAKYRFLASPECW